jgi:2-phosphosulfolactate phosphatase
LDALAGTCSPEAEVARAAFHAMRADLPRLLHDCASGQELVARGYEEDVHLAAQLNVSDAVPVLWEGAYHRLGKTQNSGQGAPVTRHWCRGS